MGASSSSPGGVAGGAEAAHDVAGSEPPVDVFPAPDSSPAEQRQARSPGELPDGSPAAPPGDCAEGDTPDALQETRPSPEGEPPAGEEGAGEAGRSDPVHVHIHLEIPRDEVPSTPKQNQGDYSRLRFLDPRSPTENRTPMIATHAE